MACDLALPVEVLVTGPVENASAVGVPVAVAAAVVGTGVEAGIPVTAAGAALGRVPRETNDQPQHELAAQQPSVVLDGTAVVQQGAADAGTQADKIKT